MLYLKIYTYSAVYILVHCTHIMTYTRLCPNDRNEVFIINYLFLFLCPKYEYFVHIINLIHIYQINLLS